MGFFQGSIEVIGWTLKRGVGSPPALSHQAKLAASTPKIKGKEHPLTRQPSSRIVLARRRWSWEVRQQNRSF